jgi:hypothetical protein
MAESDCRQQSTVFEHLNTDWRNPIYRYFADSITALTRGCPGAIGFHNGRALNLAH